MRRWLSALCMALLPLAAAATATAQEAPLAGNVAVAPALLTLDVDRLFAQSAFGERISRDYNDGRADLATENRRIADALREEELALAASRATMAPDVFRSEADAFDERTQGIRRAQDAKERALDEGLDLGRAQFLEAARPILGQLMVERGASAVLDRRAVLLSLGTIDITDEAIARVNATLGDGASAADPSQETDDP